MFLYRVVVCVVITCHYVVGGIHGTLVRDAELLPITRCYDRVGVFAKKVYCRVSHLGVFME